MAYKILFYDYDTFTNSYRINACSGWVGHEYNFTSSYFTFIYVIRIYYLGKRHKFGVKSEVICGDISYQQTVIMTHDLDDQFLDLTKLVYLAMHSSAYLVEDKKDIGSWFQSLTVLDIKMNLEMSVLSWHVRKTHGCIFDSAYLGDKGHLLVYWLYPLDLCK